VVVSRESMEHLRIIRTGVKEFVYKYEDTGKEVQDDQVLKRIQAMHIPPAYTGVKIASNDTDKVQAFGYDSKGRKQIVYAKWFVDKQNDKKFERVLQLDTMISKLMHHVDRTLHSVAKSITHMCHDIHVSVKHTHICVIVKLMMLCNFRIGNAVNATKYKSYGLTTIEWRHVSFDHKKREVRIAFIGKKGVLNDAICTDKNMYIILRRMHACETKEGHNGSDNHGSHDNHSVDKVFGVTSGDVNAFIKKFGDNVAISSKDIRTWHANVIFVKHYIENKDEAKSATKRQSNALKSVAEQLHNTPAVCKKSYIMPDLIHTTS